MMQLYLIPEQISNFVTKEVTDRQRPLPASASCFVVDSNVSSSDTDTLSPEKKITIIKYQIENKYIVWKVPKQNMRLEA